MFVMVTTACGRQAEAAPLPTETPTATATPRPTETPTATPTEYVWQPPPIICAEGGDAPESVVEIRVRESQINLHLAQGAKWQDCTEKAIQVALENLPSQCLELKGDIWMFPKGKKEEAVQRMVDQRQLVEPPLPIDEIAGIDFGGGGGGGGRGWSVWLQGFNWERWDEDDIELLVFEIQHTYHLCQEMIITPNKMHQIPISIGNGVAQVWALETINRQEEWNSLDPDSIQRTECVGITLVEAEAMPNKDCALSIGYTKGKEMIDKRGWDAWYSFLTCMQVRGRHYTVCFSNVYGVGYTDFSNGAPIPPAP